MKFVMSSEVRIGRAGVRKTNIIVNWILRRNWKGSELETVTLRSGRRHAWATAGHTHSNCSNIIIRVYRHLTYSTHKSSIGN